ncbi:condensation domain-containing protein [Streptomyces sp. NPDC050617]|uniref:condensation domain-containing protein n=1 Tax=Streptomyces sp. NPDC050617 TaxID=3154628 RepID=UPI00343B2DF6
MTGGGERAGRPLSAVQRSMWTAYRVAPGSSAYNIVMPLRVRGPLSVPALEQAVADLGARQAQLRSSFTEADGEPVRLERPEPFVRLEVRDVPGIGLPELYGAVRRAGEEPFDLEGGGPFRVVLLRRADDDFALVTSAHHIVGDFTSRWLLVRDLLHAYRGRAAGTDPGLPALRGSYEDHVREEAEFLGSPAGRRAAAYWRDAVAGTSAAELPLDRPRPALPSHRGDTVRLHLPLPLSDELMSSAKELGTTPYALLLAAFQALVHRWTGRTDFLLGAPATNRIGKERRNVVGCFLNTLPVRARTAPSDSLRTLAAAAEREVLGGMLQVRHPCTLPPADGAAAGAGRAPLFRMAVFLVQLGRMDPPVPSVPRGAPEGPPIGFGGLGLALIDVPQQEGQLDLMVRLEHGADGLTAVFSYDTDLFERATVERLASAYERFVRVAAEAPDTAVGDVELLAGDELAALLALGAGDGAGEYG